MTLMEMYISGLTKTVPCGLTVTQLAEVARQAGITPLVLLDHLLSSGKNVAWLDMQCCANVDKCL